MEARRQKAENAEAQKRKAEAEALARQKAENCTVAKQGIATLDTGVRLVRANDKGEPEVLDDAARDAERRRLQAIMASDCAN